MVWHNEIDDLDGIELPLNLHIEEKTDNFINICQCGLYVQHTKMSSSKHNMNILHLHNCEVRNNTDIICKRV